MFTNIGTIAEQSLYINLLFDFLDIPTEDMAGKKKISHIEKLSWKMSVSNMEMDMC